MPITLIALDADDTLWHHETFFRLTQERFAELLGEFVAPERLSALLAATEQANLGVYGYGAKGFTLSMLETALAVGGDRVSGSVLAEILALGKELMRHPVEPLPGVRAALEELAGLGRLVLVTKGELFHQEAKLAASGLGALFSAVEVVSDKNAATYRRIFERQGSGPDGAVMAGNSVRSDVLPVLEVGGYAALIPYPLVWAHEAGIVPHGHARFRVLGALGELAGWIEELKRGFDAPAA